MQKIPMEKNNTENKQNLLTQKQSPSENYKEFNQRDKLYLGCDKGNQYEWSISQEKITYTFENLMKNCIQSIQLYDNKKKILISDRQGNQKILDLVCKKIIKIFDKIHTSIYALCITKNNKYFFTGNCDKNPNVKQWSLSNFKLIQDYKNVFDSRFGITSILTTPDENYLFIAGTYILSQYELKNHMLVKIYKTIMIGCIFSMSISYCNKYLFQSDYYGYITKILIKDRIPIKNSIKIGEDGTYSITLTKDFDILFVATNCKVKMINSGTFNVLKENQAHTDIIKSIVYNNAENILFTSSHKGDLKEWYVEPKDFKLKKDHGFITKKGDIIFSLCL